MPRTVPQKPASLFRCLLLGAKAPRQGRRRAHKKELEQLPVPRFPPLSHTDNGTCTTHFTGSVGAQTLCDCDVLHGLRSHRRGPGEQALDRWSKRVMSYIRNRLTNLLPRELGCIWVADLYLLPVPKVIEGGWCDNGNFCTGEERDKRSISHPPTRPPPVNINRALTMYQALGA